MEILEPSPMEIAGESATGGHVCSDGFGAAPRLAIWTNRERIDLDVPTHSSE